MPESTAPIKLLVKLNLVMSEVGYMQKKGKAQAGSFSFTYVGEAQLKEKIQPLLIKHKLICIPIAASLRRELHEFDKYDSKGTVLGRDRECFADVEMTFRIFDCESGEYIDGQFCGTGHDKPGDKAVNKAETSAERDFIKAVFFIPTGTEPETDIEPDDEAPRKAEPPAKAAKPAPAREMPAEPPESPHDRAHHRLKELLIGKGIEGERAAKLHKRLSLVPEDHIEDFFNELKQELVEAPAQSDESSLTKTEEARLAHIEAKFAERKLTDEQQSELVALCSGGSCLTLE